MSSPSWNQAELRVKLSSKNCCSVVKAAGFHTCVSRTHSGTRCLSMYGHHCSQPIPALAIKTCVLATKSHMLNFCEACAAMCCDCDLLEPITQGTTRFSVLRKKKSKAKNKKCNNDFQKVVIFNSIPDALHVYIPPNTKTSQ